MTPSNKPKGTLVIGIKPSSDAPMLRSPEDDDNDPMPTGGKQECSTCYAYRPSDGRCQMYPPHGMEWSQVQPEDYCCQWKAGPQHDGAGQQPIDQAQQQPQSSTTSYM